MSLFDKFNKASAAARLIEEKLYEIVVKELENGERRDGLWAKALANTKGNETTAKALYLKYRVQSLKDEAHIHEELENKKQAEKYQARINSVYDVLYNKGYKFKQSGNCFFIRDPNHIEWEKFEDIDSLESFADNASQVRRYF